MYAQVFLRSLVVAISVILNLLCIRGISEIWVKLQRRELQPGGKLAIFFGGWGGKRCFFAPCSVLNSLTHWKLQVVNLKKKKTLGAFYEAQVSVSEDMCSLNQMSGKQWLQSHTDRPVKEVLRPWISPPLFMSKPLLKHDIINSHWCRVWGGEVWVVWRCYHHISVNSLQQSAVVSDWQCVQPTDVSATSTRKSIKIKPPRAERLFIIR